MMQVGSLGYGDVGSRLGIWMGVLELVGLSVLQVSSKIFIYMWVEGGCIVLWN